MNTNPQQQSATPESARFFDPTLAAPGCSSERAEHCVTCSDQALELLVLQVDVEHATALVAIDSGTEEIDISLLEVVGPGDIVLVHGGVALERCGLAIKREGTDGDGSRRK
ncbi:hypothetical protein KDA_59340 [Dictyobacter alpinus]|uniref:Hydrogenase assembly protein HupF n=1 Tax=Dictyobacter alpinus TaxID=2014873 RepID=A0A402BGQ6_9CHLR|nr:HypC/HybG/HupF family hydrogenase formation chaperone [Dictyobacter alpinus]GCE30450.1 hypothetical protein KDA_59340 [Dictyobacter alpinus]